MGIGIRWTTTALLGVAAGAGAALARARRRPAAPPRTAMGVDGLGEPAPSITLPASAPSPAVEPVPEPAAAVVADVPAPPDPSRSVADDPIAALDAARERLRRRAEELQREMGEAGRPEGDV